VPICDKCKRDVVLAHPCCFGEYNLCEKCYREWEKHYTEWKRGNVLNPSSRKVTDEEWLREFHRFIGLWSVS